MKKILIADDMNVWREFNKQAVKNLFGSNIQVDLAESAEDGYQKVIENLKSPYDVIITDLQMEDVFFPKQAGEWLIEQVQMLSEYYKTKIVLISGSNNIKYIAENLNVNFIPKSTAGVSMEIYHETFRDII